MKNQALVNLVVVSKGWNSVHADPWRQGR